MTLPPRQYGVSKKSPPSLPSPTVLRHSFKYASRSWRIITCRLLCVSQKALSSEEYLHSRYLSHTFLYVCSLLVSSAILFAMKSRQRRTYSLQAESPMCLTRNFRDIGAGGTIYLTQLPDILRNFNSSKSPQFPKSWHPPPQKSTALPTRKCSRSRGPGTDHFAAQTCW